MGLGPGGRRGRRAGLPPRALHGPEPLVRRVVVVADGEVRLPGHDPERPAQRPPAAVLHAPEGLDGGLGRVGRVAARILGPVRRADGGDDGRVRRRAVPRLVGGTTATRPTAAGSRGSSRCWSRSARSRRSIRPRRGCIRWGRRSRPSARGCCCGPCATRRGAALVGLRRGLRRAALHAPLRAIHRRRLVPLPGALRRPGSWAREPGRGPGGRRRRREGGGRGRGGLPPRHGPPPGAGPPGPAGLLDSRR